MPKTYTLSPQARIDIQDIIRFIATDNPQAARKLKSKMMEACANLGLNPHLGQERDDLTHATLRFWPAHRNYMIVYDATTHPVRIVRIYNNARDITSILPQ